MEITKLAEDEKKVILRTELTQRIKDELQGDAEEAPSIIREYKAKILLACKDHSLARRFFTLLEWECKGRRGCLHPAFPHCQAGSRNGPVSPTHTILLQRNGESLWPSAIDDVGQGGIPHTRHCMIIT